ncbi:MAG: hypothetical protein ACE5JS_05975 [Nitrospinota bacterium]
MNGFGYDVDLRYGLVMNRPEQFGYLLDRGWFVTVFLCDSFVAMANSN